MNKIALALLLFSCQLSYGQSTINTKQYEIKYNNGLAKFNVCINGCNTNFDDTKEYKWYSEFSKIKITKGGAGGNLLHGSFKFFDNSGNLTIEENYFLGLLNGEVKSWDSLGNIESKFKYIKGEVVYSKTKNDRNLWVENIGKPITIGWIQKVYTEDNILVSEKILREGLISHVKTYYLSTHNLKEEYNSDPVLTDFKEGKYLEYYSNGKPKLQGQYYEGKCLNVKIGKWNSFDINGNLEDTDEYKAHIEKWPSGKIKLVGELTYYSEKNLWIKTGIWWYFDEYEKFKETKEYRWGVEIE